MATSPDRQYNHFGAGGIEESENPDFPEDLPMSQKRCISLLATLFAAVLISAPANAGNVNKSVKIGDNAVADGASTVNGSITVGADATINGSVETVNGAIRVGDRSKIGDAETVNGSIKLGAGVSAEDVSSVNGSIRLDEEVTIDGEVEVVNGKISLAGGARVARDLSNVNGEIELHGALVGGDVSTVNGDVSLADASTVEGNLIVDKPSGWGWRNEHRKPRIIIGPGSKVVGNIDLKREVELFISESAEVGGVIGEMSLADAVRFSGEHP